MIPIRSVFDDSFRPYGRIIREIDASALIAEMQNTPRPDGEVAYVPSVEAFERLSVFQSFRDVFYGGMPIQIGYCSGENHTLNAVEYHRDSEINVCATDMILLIGKQQDVCPDTFSYDTAHMEAFLAPAGTVVEMYATTLHYAPISASPGEKFCCAVVLPRGTNVDLPFAPERVGEAKLLFAVNKWLIAHPESGMDAENTFIGLIGENLTI